MLLDASQLQSIEQAADILASGGLLGLPTETVYGLAARADDDQAVAAIFAAKGRPVGHPLIVHVADAEAAEHFVAKGFLEQLPDHAAALMQAFWPGPLTVIVPRRAGVADAAAGQHPTIGLRCPAHPAAQAVLHALQQRGVPGLAAPSANRFGSVSPTTAHHVEQEFGEQVPVLDAGACPVGIESTIIDCSRGAPVMLRPGAITPQAIFDKLRVRVQPAAAVPSTAGTASSPSALSAPQAPGTLLAHYAPRAKLRIMGAKDMQAALDVLGRDAPAIGIWSRTPMTSASSKVRLATMPTRAEDAARELFARLRAFDEQGMTLIWVEPVPITPEWEAVADRLRRAAAA